MKRLTIILILAVFGFQNCKGQSNRNDNNSTAVSKAPAQTVSDKTSPEGGSILLTKSVFLEKVWDFENSPQEWNYKGDKPAIVDFYADWCGPCRIASPILEEISNEYAGQINVYKIDTEKEKELAAVFGIRSIPAFLYIPTEGKPVMIPGIARTKEDTRKMFKDNINKYLLTAN